MNPDQIHAPQGSETGIPSQRHGFQITDLKVLIAMVAASTITYGPVSFPLSK